MPQPWNTRKNVKGTREKRPKVVVTHDETKTHEEAPRRLSSKARMAIAAALGMGMSVGLPRRR